jgi:multiple sugar transport system permease protein
LIASKLEKGISFTLTLCALLVLVVLLLFPVYWILTISLKTQVEAFKTPPSHIFVPTFDNYRRLFVEANFFRYYLNSIIVSVGATVTGLFFGVPASYALSRGNFKGKNALLFGVLTSQMAPPILFIIPYFMVYIRVGLIDTWIGLIIVFLSTTLALVIWSMRAFFDDVPIELEEAARIDGASDFQTFFRVILPLVATGMVATGIFAMILSWNQFLFPLVLSRSRTVTATVAVIKFASAEAEDWGLMTSGSIILTLPVIVFTIVIRKFLQRGMVSGALKG